MGIESEQLVYDYLSRVGDLAQQRQLSSGERMELVASVRGRIEQERAKAPSDSPASVRRILGRLGTPDELVKKAGGSPGTAAPRPVPVEPAAPDRLPLPAPRVRKLIPRPRKDRAAPAVPPPPASPPGLPPHLAGLDELGSSRGSGPDLDGIGGDGDWWTVQPRPYGAGERVGGFTGGVEVPEILHPPRDDEDEPEAGEDAEDEPEEESAPPPGLLPKLLARRAKDPEKAAATAVAAGLGSPLLLLAALLLIGGAVFGTWIAFAAGWLIAYASRRLGPAQTKVAVFVIPGAAVAAGCTWLWGRSTGRWGTPLPDEAMRDAFLETGPWVLRGAAVASALYLIWRARKV
ncbi:MULTISPECIES: hypothetical protein [Streptomyces]|uniref:Uncharacterized protein n=1 Tax=Streptomyces tsukubensis (strain DSM 42081 / NBRC 108919 / NRRL 18488 / 9993) TaxID=1114943 RepID=I2N0K9_STRT9|nr:hypothetical protein [Streptomyces tsukubensis]MYS68690.1 hypothetical protein [Streptomyces sp. SID5473]AZK94760.1 hypothetical protein B7R87_13465 [Streptomyces tsukubensis]EIF90556.1 hypothetical protein [Streptomyces tsukubensis NRRL18488]QKM69159.1 hypothetical protein STSU_020305 [Streptomyces tsukubensis NRRL18488]TAI42911.1 hypothetical protein EWI31_21230 [Streptomyces tsukubensis]